MNKSRLFAACLAFLISRFFLMPESQHIYGIISRFVAVQNHIARVAKVDNQLAQFW